MNSYCLRKGDDQLKLLLETRPDPSPGPKDLVIQMKAASINYRDLLVLSGKSASGGVDTIPLSDGSGEVVACGNEVTRFSVGDKVCGIFFPTWTDGPFDMSYHKDALGGSRDGVLCEYVTLPETGVVGMPAHLSWEEAACFPCAGVTAWAGLIERGQLESDATVLLLGTGGVSIMALQLATAMGARVIQTSSSDDKLEKARALGAWKTVNYKSHPDWDKEVWALSGDHGVDHVVEVGGPGTLERSMRCVAAGGHIALIGVLTGMGAPECSLFPLVARSVRLDGIYVGSRKSFENLNAFLKHHEIRPVVDRVFSFEDAAKAYDHLERGTHFGKVVVKIE